MGRLDEGQTRGQRGAQVLLHRVEDLAPTDRVQSTEGRLEGAKAPRKGGRVCEMEIGVRGVHMSVDKDHAPMVHEAGLPVEGVAPRAQVHYMGDTKVCHRFQVLTRAKPHTALHNLVAPVPSVSSGHCRALRACLYGQTMRLPVPGRPR